MCLWNRGRSGPNLSSLSNEEHDLLLASFIWGNTNSLEKYDITASENKVDFPTWQKVKSASRVFDNAQHVINAFNPRLMLVLNWSEDLEWLTYGNEYDGPTDVADHIQYYLMKKRNTNVFWLSHPRWIASNQGFVESIAEIEKFIENRHLFDTLPMEDSPITSYFGRDQAIDQVSAKRRYIAALASFLCANEKIMSGGELSEHLNRNGFKTTYGTQYEGGRGMYTLIRKTWHWYEHIEKNSELAAYIAKAFVKENGEYAYE